MARREALLRLHKTLLSRRTDLRKRLGSELADLRKLKDESGDSADVAFDTGSEEISTQLAELDARELNQIERALARMKQGTYGLCEVCQGKIPVARLNALPYSTTCVDCQREMETYPGWEGGRGGRDWEKLYDAGAHPEEEREVSISEIEMDLTSH
jgi:DnaK suppressor protein